MSRSGRNSGRYPTEPEKYDIRPAESHTLPWWIWQAANWMRSGQVTTPTAKHLWGYRDRRNCNGQPHVMTCKLFGERPSREDIVIMGNDLRRGRVPFQTRHEWNERGNAIRPETEALVTRAVFRIGRIISSTMPHLESIDFFLSCPSISFSIPS